MVSAFVLIKTETGKTKEVFENLSKILKTKHRHMVFGAYDIVVKIKTRTNDDLIAIVNTKIKSNPGVKAAIVLQCWEEEEGTVETL
ncbi:MAG: Lrp/AsnC ligand binding domain-containing protein [Thermoplasmata archaeon]|nr:Lrp/AsnC ligand binding domain-containing protein [Thermoplasmata archaeon]